MVEDLSDQERVRLIRKSLRECDEPVTRQAILRQFKYETGRYPTFVVKERGGER